MCIPNQEYQLINPTTQVALYGQCYGDCSNIEQIQWNIYSGKMNPLTNFTDWILFNQTQLNDQPWFFGLKKKFLFFKKFNLNFRSKSK